MTKRSLAFTVASIVAIILAFAAPSQAGTTVVTTDITLLGIAPNTITDIDVFYNPIGTITNISTTGGTLVPISTLAAGTGEVITSFSSPVNSGTLQYTFDTTSPAVGLLYYTYSGASAPISTLASIVTVTSAVVPEPTSMALLGIGMSALMVFRGYFSRRSIA